MSFSNFKVKKWENWMTQCVLLHASGCTIPELRMRFGFNDSHIQNVLNSQEARDIIESTQERMKKSSNLSTKDMIGNIRQKALKHFDTLLSNDELLETRPFAFWDAARKTLEAVEKVDRPAPVMNIQQNILNAAPDLLAKLRAAPTLTGIEVSHNVEYLGSPPPAGEVEGAVLRRGVSAPESKSKDRLTLVSGSSSPSTPE